MQPQLEATSAIAPIPSDRSIAWFRYPICVQPHHTDYTGAAWHGSYVAWMEEARVEYFRSLGASYADLVALGCDLPVVELSIRYHRSLQMGVNAIVNTRMSTMEGVRIIWEYRVESVDGQELYATAQVVLVTVDREKGKIMRQLPPAVQDMLSRLLTGKETGK